MFYTIILLLIFSFVLLIVDRKNRYSWFFVMMAVGFIMAFFSLVLHIRMFGSYYSLTRRHAWFALDFSIYSYIARATRISLGTAIRIMNAGLALYLLSIPLFFFEVNKTLHQISGRKISRHMFNAMLFAAPVITIIYCDPLMSMRFYILCLQHEWFFDVLNAFTHFYKLMIIVIVMSPVYMLIRYSHVIMVAYLKKRILLLAGCLFLVNCAFVGFFYLGPYSISADKVRRSGFWIFENTQFGVQDIHIWMPTITMALLSLCMAILLSFRLDFSITPFFSRKVHQNINLMNEALGDMLHSQKNLLFTLRILARKAETRCNYSNSPDTDRLNETIDNSIQNTSAMLDQLRQVKYRFIRNDLVDIIESACHQVVIPENIRIEIDYSNVKTQYGMYDKYHLGKAFVNILINAVEALEKSEKDDKYIRVELSYIFRQVAVVITDNGTGIRHRDIKKLFLPHYTNKNGTLNWGLGLSYVYRVVSGHLGQVKIDSRPGRYTTVLIMLPLKS